MKRIIIKYISKDFGYIDKTYYYCGEFVACERYNDTNTLHSLSNREKCEVIDVYNETTGKKIFEYKNKDRIKDAMILNLAGVK